MPNTATQWPSPVNNTDSERGGFSVAIYDLTIEDESEIVLYIDTINQGGVSINVCVDNPNQDAVASVAPPVPAVSAVDLVCKLGACPALVEGEGVAEVDLPFKDEEGTETTAGSTVVIGGNDSGYMIIAPGSYAEGVSHRIYKVSIVPDDSPSAPYKARVYITIK